MSTEADELGDREQRLQAILLGYLQALDAGKAPSRQELLDQHPEFASDLQSFFADQDRIDRLAQPLRGEGPAEDDRPIAEVPTMAPPEGTAASDPALGTKIRYFGDYELLEEIARGAMGVVFKARQKSLQRIVAVKLILAGRLASPLDVQRFHTEATNAANLDHPNIVPIYEVGEHQGQHYFSMKLIEGNSLAHHVTRLHQDARAAARLLATTARAVHHAHQRGILHRDLKPANILLDGLGEAHVTDFGLAKRDQGEPGQTQSGAIVGTPSYMAPEQAAARRDLTTAADVYSLGSILYELLTGRPPFRADTTFETLRQVMECEPEKPRSLSPRLDRDLEVICLKCLEKDPRRRYGSAEALADDLECWLNGRPIRARPAGSWEQLVKWARRRPAAAALAGVSIAAVITVGALLMVLYTRAEADARRAQEHSRELAEQAEKERDLSRKLGLQKTELSDLNRELGREKENIRRNLYDTRINLIQQAWEEGNMPRMQELLEAEQLRPDAAEQPGFEWLYFWRLAHRDRFTAPALTSVASIAANGRMLATLAPEWGVKLWNVETGRHTSLGNVVNTLTEGALPCSLALAPDGKILATGYRNSVFMYDVGQSKELPRLEGHRAMVCAVAFAGDGQTLASADWKGDVILWDLTKRAARVQWQAHAEPVFRLWIAPDGKTLVTGTQAGVRRWWDPAKGKSKPIPKGAQGVLPRQAFSPDGAHLAIGRTRWNLPLAGGLFEGMLSYLEESQEDMVLSDTLGDVSLHDAVTGAVKARLKDLPGKLTELTFSPDGKILACASAGGPAEFSGGRVEFQTRPGQLRLWDVAAGRQRAVVEYPGGVWAVAFAPNSRTLAVAVGPFGEIRICDAATGKEAGNVFRGHTAPVSRLAFSSDGKLLFSVSQDRTVKVWEVGAASNPVVVAPLDFMVGSDVPARVGFSPDGQTLIAGGGPETFLLDLKTGRRRTKWGWTSLKGAVFHPDGRQLLARGDWPLSDPINIVDVKTLKYVGGLKAYSSLILAVSPNGRFVAAVKFFSRHQVQAWDLVARRALATFGPPEVSDQVRCLDFAPDSKTLATGGDDKPVHLWSTTTWKETKSLRGHTQPVTGVAFSPDGHTLASVTGFARDFGLASGRPGEVKLWDVASGKELHALIGHMGPVTSVAFSPDGRTLATGSDDQTVRLWDVATGQYLATLAGARKPIAGLAFQPRGNSLVAICKDGTLLHWQAAAKAEVLGRR
jgi:WD40 repeat protein/tRNA A-37 threonylcarbamoyl transferase component Bud32